MTCRPGANPFIEQWFGDCIYNGRDMVGFVLGLASICAWMVAQVPQLVKNYQTKSAEALSPWFLAEWLLGDTCNLLGALLKGDQLPTVVFTAQYFICMDAVLLVQYIYYTSLQRRRERTFARRHSHRHRHRRHHHRSSSRRHAPDSAGLEAAAAAQQGQQQQEQSSGAQGADISEVVTHSEAASPLGAASGSNTGNGREFVFRPQRVMACVGLLFLLASTQQPRQEGAQLEQPQGVGLRRLLVVGNDSLEQLSKMPSWSREVGTVIAYCSSVLYLTSRVSQIFKNFKRRSAEGLALTMFLCAIAANTLYGLSIVVRAYSLAELQSSLPWLIGSLGTVALDMTIFAQGLVYGTEKKHASDEEESLLPGEDGKH